MEIVKIPVSKINPLPHNPRKDLKPTDIEYQQIEKSLDTFGLVEPPVWNKETGNLVGGHQRFKILVRKGHKEIWVSVVSLSPEKEKALNIALNKVQGAWDKEKLALLLDELIKMPDFDLTATGFTPPELSQLFDRYLERKGEDDFDTQKVADSIKEPKAKPGEIIELGPHRILCGDCSILENLKHLIGNEKVGLANIDPPYNVAYMGGERPNPKARPKKSRHWERIYADNMDDKDYQELLRQILSNISSFMVPGAAAYIWNGHKNFGPMHTILEELGFQVSSVIVWAKPNFAISYADYHEQVEFCLYGWLKGKGAHRWYGDVNQSTLWELKRDPTKDYIHPTQKPIGLAQRAITNSSVKGDIVLDTFLGSGSTLIAAESLGRRCFGCEISPAYVDAICLRYMQFVGPDKVSDELRKRYMKEV